MRVKTDRKEKGGFVGVLLSFSGQQNTVVLICEGRLLTRSHDCLYNFFRGHFIGVLSDRLVGQHGLDDLIFLHNIHIPCHVRVFMGDVWSWHILAFAARRCWRHS